MNETEENSIEGASYCQTSSNLYQCFFKIVRIPYYQRGYAWNHEQLVDFWEDLLNLHEDRYHYTGLLSLKAVSRKETRLWHEDKWLLEGTNLSMLWMGSNV